MKILVVNILILYSLLNSSNYSETRNLYQNAHQNQTNSEVFFTHTKEKSQHMPDDSVLKTYYGAALIIQSKFEEKPAQKIKLLKAGCKIIDAEVKQNPKHLELRFIRLSIQENLPDKINYDNIEDDKKVMIQLINQSPSNLKEYIFAYVESSNVFSKSEKKYFE